jgi:hypothetical protein
MKKFIVGNGKEQKTYQLELSFNTVVDTDLMEKMEDCQKIIKDLQDATKKKNAEARKEILQITTKLFGLVRYMMFICLQENHEDEFQTEKQAGKLIQRAISENGVNIIDIFNIIDECASEADFLSKMMGGQEPPVQPQDHQPKVVK